jgi:hypothetical protein
VGPRAGLDMEKILDPAGTRTPTPTDRAMPALKSYTSHFNSFVCCLNNDACLLTTIHYCSILTWPDLRGITALST